MKNDSNIKGKYGCLKSVITLLIIAIVLFFIIIDQAVKYEIDSASAFSKSIEESKKRELFLGYYSPTQDSLYLDTLVLPAETIWYEKQWHTNHRWFYDEYFVEIDSGINLIAPFPYEIELNYKNEFFHGSLKKRDVGHILFIDSDSPDSINIYFSISRNENARDTILYIRQ